jgi:hypothetical protein
LTTNEILFCHADATTTLPQNWHNLIMKASDTLGHATLADSLNAVCYAISYAYIKGTKDLFGVSIPGEPKSGIFDEYIPGEVFDVAVNAGWIPRPYEPEEDHGLPLGAYYVEEHYRDWFIGLLDESLSRLRETVSKNDDDDEETQKLKTELWQILFLRVGDYTIKRLTPHEQPGAEVESTAPQAPTEPSTTVMPEWGAAFKAAQIPETTADERKALEKKYLATHKHPAYADAYEKQELQWMANVHRKQWERWRRCQIANDSHPGRRILDLLERNTPTKSPQKLPQRNRQKLTV